MKNILKISLASIISILISKILNLDFYISAGIITILTIQSTKKETIQTAFERFVAFIIALMIALICFYLFDSLFAFIIYLFIYIFICQTFKWNSSMAVNSVLISHFLSFESITISNLFNEIGLFVIGVSIGVITNLFMKKNIDAINNLKNQADEQIKYILERMSQRIVNDIDDYDGSCFDKLNILLTQAKAQAIQNEKNELFSNSLDHDYLLMREHQTQVLYEMYKHIRTLDKTTTSHILSDFLLKISKEYDVNNTCVDLLIELNQMHDTFKQIELPKTREEFEHRARLFIIMQLIKEFLEIKYNYSKNYPKV